MNILELLDHYRIPHCMAGRHEHVRSGWVGVDCPYCSAQSQHWRLGIHLTYLRASCWACGGVSLFRALQELTGEPYRVLSQLLDKAATEEAEPKQRGKVVLPTGLGPLLPVHRRYLEGRGLDPDEVSSVWGMRGIGGTGPLRWRVWLPFQQEGRTVSWTTRSVGTAQPRYWSAAPHQESVSHKDLLLGEDLAGSAVVVVEGPFDALKIGPGAVATCGLAYSTAQVARLARFALRAICFDNEPEALRRARKLTRDLAVFPGETLLVRLRAKDPGSAGGKELKQIRAMLR